jgi:uncharacterized protein
VTEVSKYAAGVPAWVELGTADLDAAKRFYGELLGWEFHSDDGQYHLCRVRDHQVAGMYATDRPTGWVTYMATDDVDAVAARVREHGGTVMSGPDDAGESGRYVVATDPAGVVFGAWQAGQLIGSTLVNEEGAVIWNELVTPDLAAAREFYSGVFGYTWDDLDTGGQGPPYATFSAEGQMAGGALQGGADDQPRWHVYFGVDDTDAAAAAVPRLGGTVVSPPADSPYGRFTVIRDPEGAALSVGVGADGG